MGEIVRSRAFRKSAAFYLGFALLAGAAWAAEEEAAREEAEELPGNEECAACHSSKDLKKKLLA